MQNVSNAIETRTLKRFDVVTINEDIPIPESVHPLLAEEPHLIVWVEISLNEIFLINLHTRARFPICLPYDKVIEQIEEGFLELCDLDLNKRVFLPESALTKKQVDRIKERFSAIEPLIVDLEATLRNARDQKLFETTAKNAKRSKQYLYDTFYSYLRHKCFKQALFLPQGKEANRVIKKKVYTKKPGAHCIGKPSGKLLTERDYKIFEYGKRLYRTRRKISIRKVVTLMWDHHYYKERSLNPLWKHDKRFEKYIVIPLEAHEKPSYRQFLYWLNCQFEWNIALRDKTKHRSNDVKANLEGRSGNAFEHVIAPGQVFMLDETPFDEELVSAFDVKREQKVASATLYFVIDVATYCIVGLYITLLSPSFATIREAIFNAARDKANFFKERDIPYDPALWPQRGIATTFFVDNAELNNQISDGAGCSLHSIFEFGRKGRGDDKGKMEKIFDVFRGDFEGLSDALKSKKLNHIYDQISRDKACLTVEELYIIAVRYIIHHNNHHVVESARMPREMIVDGVNPIPNEMWQWGLKNNPGYLINLSEEEIYMSLLEQGTVSVHDDHLLLLGQDLHYTCKWTKENGLQDTKVIGNRSPRLPCRYHRSLMQKIYICTSSGLMPAEFTLTDQKYSGLSLEEIQFAKRIEKEKIKDLKSAEYADQATLFNLITSMTANAKREQSDSKTREKSSIKINRKLEAVEENLELALRYMQAMPENLPLDDDDEDPVQEVAPVEATSKPKRKSVYDDLLDGKLDED